MPHDYIFKFIIAGDTGVGKSSLLTQFLNQKLWHLRTYNVEVVRQIINIDYNPDIKFKLRIWDMASYFTKDRRSVCRGAMGALLVYDVTRRETFDHLDGWVDVLRQHGNANMVITIVGNKCDLANWRVVSTEEGEQFARKHDFPFVETSVKTAQNIEVFIETAVAYHKKLQNKEAFFRTVSTVYEKIQEEERQIENLGEKIERLQRKTRELKKMVKERDVLILKMLIDCKSFLPTKDGSEQVAKSANRQVDILGEVATITNSIYGDEY